jgi:hypothetical protein
MERAVHLNLLGINLISFTGVILFSILVHYKPGWQKYCEKRWEFHHVSTVLVKIYSSISPPILLQRFIF